MDDRGVLQGIRVMIAIQGMGRSVRDRRLGYGSTGLSVDLTFCLVHCSVYFQNSPIMLCT
jgi:hypothetical protein